MILKLLGDQTRLTMLKLMDKRACCVCEFVDIFQASQPSISQHLRKLRDLGFVMEERKGQWIFYSLNKRHAFYRIIQPILNQLPAQDETLTKLDAKGRRMSCG